jgi:hypothetical protein
MDRVVANKRAASVMTAPAAMKPSPVVNKIAQAIIAAFSEYSVRPILNVMIVEKSISRKAGSRAANSLKPSSLKEAAVNHVDSGGLPQKGTPISICGVSQSPLTTMSLATSA